MRNIIITLLAITTVGLSAAAEASAANRGGRGHDHGGRNDSVEINRQIPHHRERVRWVRGESKCGYQRVRLYDDYGNVYNRRMRVCDRNWYNSY